MPNPPPADDEHAELREWFAEQRRARGRQVPPDGYAALEAMRKEAAEERRRATDGASPCDGCRHVERCRTGLACAALKLFVVAGRLSAVAPRFPSRAIYDELYPAGP